MITLFLVLHVAGAVVALGFSLAYAVWIARGEATGPAERAFALRTVSWIDRRMTTPAYVLQLVTGLVLVWLLDWTVLRQSWLEISLVLYAALTILAIARFAPMHRRRSALAVRLAAGEAVEADYSAAAAQAQRWGIVVTVLTLAILVLMVWQPIWW